MCLRASILAPLVMLVALAFPGSAMAGDWSSVAADSAGIVIVIEEQPDNDLEGTAAGGAGEDTTDTDEFVTAGIESDLAARWMIGQPLRCRRPSDNNLTTPLPPPNGL